ncbi:MAG: ribosomal-processing cysteine protease Prp [Defluviitaleaceae bacterium]|nr:ribosomal-processing cysteine protease Prp [Defluviitaleaceae bacterium]
MIKVFLYYNKNRDIYRFKVLSHGQEIVCAGVSALVITCANFIQSQFNLDVVEKHGDTGYIDFEVGDIKRGTRNHAANLIIDNMVFGLRLIEESYGDDIQINIINS